MTEFVKGDLSPQELHWLRQEFFQPSMMADYPVQKVQPDTASSLLLKALITIEEFVKEIAGLTGYSLARLLTKLPLLEVYRLLRNRLEFPDMLEYSEYAMVFMQAYSEVGHDHFASLNEYPVPELVPVDKLRATFTDLVSRIKALVVSSEFKARVWRRNNDSYSNYQRMVAYVDGLFEYRSVLLVLRVDFSYRQDVAATLTLEEARADLAHLLRNRRSNPRLFGDWLGYIIKTEYGVSKGYHFHALIFFDGTNRQNGVYWGMELGRYWETTITQGRGIFFNSNARKDILEDKIGTGKIGRKDVLKRRNLNRLIGYLVKAEQFIRVKRVGSKSKMVIRGVIPVRESRAGRPRVD